MEENSVTTKKDLILVVDDHPNNLKVVGTILGAEYSISFANNGENALKLLEHNHPSLILLDIMMPGIDGFEVCRRIKENPRLKQIPVIFLTARSDTDTLVKGFQAGAVDFIAKPFNIQEITVRVSTHLALYNSRLQIQDICEKLQVSEGALKLAYSELADYKDHLEELVHQRTAELQTAKEKAEESSKLKTAFINNVSHEIRTPLNGILGFNQLLAQEELTDEERTEFLSGLKKSATRLIQTVTDFLDISQLVSGSMSQRPDQFELADFFYDLTEEFELRFRQKELVLKTEFPETLEPVIITADRELFSKVFRHLIDNAEKFTHTGSVTIGFSVSGPVIEIWVKDTGVGISAENKDKIFEPYFQEDLSSTRGYEGSGLGLSIVDGLVTLMGGKVFVESQKGTGSTFIITLPSSIVTSRHAAEVNIPAAISSDDAIILIAEDIRQNYVVFDAILKKAGYQTLYAEHGLEAVETCKKHPGIALVLMDIKMPVMDGKEATSRIKKIRSDLPVIALSAYATGEELDLIRSAGCDEIIPKPVDKDKLLQAIRKYVLLTKNK